MSDVGLSEVAPAERHRLVAGRFGAVAAATDDWQAQTPVDGWVALDVVGHLVEWFPAFLAAGGVELPPGPGVGDDPAGAWEAQTAGVQALLDDPERSASSFIHPYAGTHRLEGAIDRFYTADVFMHTWDLARAAGIDADLDPEFCAVLVDGLGPMDEVLRASGQYGPRVAVAGDADPVTRLVGFIGRDPNWQPAT
jgi:uncharacterized protein (TIGR03086 family)